MGFINVICRAYLLFGLKGHSGSSGLFSVDIGALRSFFFAGVAYLGLSNAFDRQRQAHYVEDVPSPWKFHVYPKAR